MSVTDLSESAMRQVPDTRSHALSGYMCVRVEGLDFDDMTAVSAAEGLRLPHNSVASVSATRNKRQMREQLSRQGWHEERRLRKWNSRYGRSTAD